MEIVVSLGIIVSSLLHVLNEKKKWTSLVLVLCLGVGIGENASDAHDVVTDRVGITFGQGHLFGMTSGEGITRQVLGAGEQVLVMEAKVSRDLFKPPHDCLAFPARLKDGFPSPSRLPNIFSNGQ
jgi:hypothetical protein